MNRSIWMAALLAVMIALVGCQSQQSADAGPGAAPEPQAEEEDGGILGALAFWTWFEGDEEEEAEIYYEDEEEDGGILGALAFWNWFEGDGEDVEPEPDPITADMIRADMSPAMDHVAHSGEEAKNQTAKTIDDNGRQAWDDLWRALLLDRPARGTTYGIP